MKKSVITTLLAAALIPALSALQILDVKYGASDKWVDITPGFLQTKVNDDLYLGWLDGIKLSGQDPLPGKAKQLAVHFKDNDGTEKTVVLNDRSFDGIAANTPVSENFKLGSAWLGDQRKYINVTAKMADIINSGREVTLDFATLGVEGKDDPAPGKKKLVVMFYSIDGKQFCRYWDEKSKFKGSMITGAYAPVPAAKDAKSPLHELMLDTAVWQWAIPMRGVISGENNLPPVAYLYIPPDTAKVRGIVVGQFNMLERPILEHPKFREYLQKLNYAAVWIGPSPFGSSFNFKDAKQAQSMSDLFVDLAETSGYPELTKAPLIGIGHSAMASFPYELAAWQPQRALAGISYDGSTPGVEWNHDWKGAAPFDADTLKTLKGIPFLVRDGAYSGGKTNRRNVVLDKNVPGLTFSLVSDPASGHFDINDDIIDYLGYFLSRADQARNRDDGKLAPVLPESGWYMDFWQPGQPYRHNPAPAKDYRGEVTRYGEEKNWVFDEENAKILAAYQKRYDGKKLALLGYVQAGDVLPDRKDHAQIHPKFIPEADGLSFKLKGTFIDNVTEGRAVGWSGKKIGEKIEHGDDVQNIRIVPICGPVVAIDGETMAVRFDRFGLTTSRRTGEIYMLAVYPGNDQYQRIVLQSVMNIPRSNDKGIYQKIDFPAITDQKAGTKSVKLNAKVNTGMPVEYYVEYGPAYLKGDELIFTPIPAGAKYPVEVSVVAYQYGRQGEFQSAAPVNRRFGLTK